MQHKFYAIHVYHIQLITMLYLLKIKCNFHVLCGGICWYEFIVKAAPSRDLKINAYEGTYKLHIVSEPPEEVTAATRTAGIAFDNGK